MSNKIWGVIHNGALTDYDRSERKTKLFATREGYTTIGYRIEYNVFPTHEKVNGKWVKIIRNG